MIGTYSVADSAPLEYRYALDAAMPFLAGENAPVVLCGIPNLQCEIRQRLSDKNDGENSSAALWVEPLAGTWRDDLETFATILPCGAPLVIIASQAIARLLPERQSWEGRLLGFQLGGISQLRSALHHASFAIEASYGIHSVFAIGLNVWSRLLERWGRADLGDRLHFAARLHYCTTGLLATFSSITMLIAKKEADKT